MSQFMVKKLNKTQIIIFISIIIFIILLIFGIVFCINKFNKNNIKDTGIEMAEEETINTTKETIKSNSIETKSKETIKEESTTTNKETETETNKPQNIETSEAKTNIPTHPATVAPTQPQTEVKTKPTTQVQTSSQPVTQPQYYDPYTGQPISKEEYNRIWNEINNSKPTEETRAKNVYVLNDDGTINFKKSKINRGFDEEFAKLLYESKEVKNLAGELYYSVTRYCGSWGSLALRPTFFLCISDEYWIPMTFDEDWNIKKGGSGIIYDPDHLPLKEQW